MASDMPSDIALREPDRPRRFGMRALWRLTGWGFAAACSLAAVAVTAQTHTGSERMKLAFSPQAQPVAVAKVPPAARADDAEMARLEGQVQRLSADREHLTERIASLEHSLDDLTGSIKRQAAAAPSAPAAPPPVISAAPVIVPLTDGNPAAWPETRYPAAVSEQAEKPAPRAAHPAVAAAAAAAAAAPAAAATTHKTRPVRVTVPMPPERMAGLAPAPAPEPARSENPGFGLSLAGASNLSVLHLQWAAAKANFGPMLGDLKPYALAERRGKARHYRLIIGPLPTYTAAARLCARLISAHAICHPVKMAGEPM